MNKIYVVERGSCRGDAFAHEGELDLDVVKKAIAHFKKYGADTTEDYVMENVEDGDMQTILLNAIFEDVKLFKKVLKKGEGYLCFEESLVGFGPSVIPAKLQLVQAIDDGEWVL